MTARVDIILADSAQSVGGKVHLLGGGWSMQSGATPLAIVVFIEVPWDETNVRSPWRIELLDADGQLVGLPGPAGIQPFVLEGELEAGRPAGLSHGVPVTLAPMAINVGPLPLDPGRYVFRFTIDGHSEATWERAFTRLPAPAGPDLGG